MTNFVIAPITINYMRYLIIFLLFYSSCAIGQNNKSVSINFNAFTSELGNDCILLFDDLTKHKTDIKHITIQAQVTRDNRLNTFNDLREERVSAIFDYLLSRGIDNNLIDVVKKDYGNYKEANDAGKSIQLIVKASSKVIESLPDSIGYVYDKKAVRTNKKLNTFYIKEQRTYESTSEALSIINKIDSFEIDNASDTVLISSGGGAIFFPAMCFIGLKEHETVLKIKIKEITSEDKFLYENLSSVTMGGEYLEMNSAIHINAKSEFKKSLRIDSKNPVVVFLPTKAIKSDVNYYYGLEQSDNHLKWTRRITDVFPVQNNESTKCLPCKDEKSYANCGMLCKMKYGTGSLGSGKMGKYFKEQQKRKKYKTQYLCQDCRAYDYFRSYIHNAANSQQQLAQQEGYIFKTSRLGWSSIAKKSTGYKVKNSFAFFYNNTSSYEVEDLVLKLYFINQHTVLSNFDFIGESNYFEIDNLPSDLPVKYYAFKMINHRPYLAVGEMMTGMDKEVELDFKPFSSLNSMYKFVRESSLENDF